jgi:hypothetical protein
MRKTIGSVGLRHFLEAVFPYQLRTVEHVLACQHLMAQHRCTACGIGILRAIGLAIPTALVKALAIVSGKTGKPSAQACRLDVQIPVACGVLLAQDEMLRAGLALVGESGIVALIGYRIERGTPEDTAP